MTDRLAGKVALITGGAMGMGAAHVRAFVAEGAKVVVADIADDTGRALVAELGDAASYVHLDVTDAAGWEAAVNHTVETYGLLNVLVNNAGIYSIGPLEDYTPEQWNRTIAINLTGPYLGMRSALAALTAAAPASVINVSSTAGIQGYTGYHAYSASKWGLRGLTRSTAIELAERGIRVNSVHPGAIKTPLITSIMEVSDEDTTGNTLHRFAQPEEVSGLIVYLASDEASFVNGGEYVIDGGHSAGREI